MNTFKSEKQQQKLSGEQQNDLISKASKEFIWSLKKILKIPIDDDYLGDLKDGIRVSDLEQKKEINKPKIKSNKEPKEQLKAEYKKAPNSFIEDKQKEKIQATKNELLEKLEEVQQKKQNTVNRL